MKPKRPVNLDIGSIDLPLAAYASITHRITGVALFAGLAVLLYFFNLSLSDEAGFREASELAASGPGKLLLWAILSALAYHLVAGCKHLLLDFGIGETREAAPKGARAVIVISVVLAAVLGVWLW